VNAEEEARVERLVKRARIFGSDVDSLIYHDNFWRSLLNAVRGDPKRRRQVAELISLADGDAKTLQEALRRLEADRGSKSNARAQALLQEAAEHTRL
jgi:hypothetical protein